jgi:hypothetical protein
MILWVELDHLSNEGGTIPLNFGKNNTVFVCKRGEKTLYKFYFRGKRNGFKGKAGYIPLSVVIPLTDHYTFNPLSAEFGE